MNKPTPYPTTAALIADLRRIIEDRGIVAVAARAGLTRDGLTKILRRPSTRGFDRLSKVCEAAGMRLVVTMEPVEPEQKGTA